MGYTICFVWAKQWLVCFTSQLEQLEEIHKSEDSEFEQMKEEFTKRISDSETKLQSAAKVRAEDRRGFESRLSYWPWPFILVQNLYILYIL